MLADAYRDLAAADGANDAVALAEAVGYHKRKLGVKADEVASTVIGAGATLLLGLLSRFLDRRNNLPGSRWANVLILIGIIAGLLLFVSPYVFG